jgi:hypothetical protein
MNDKGDEKMTKVLTFTTHPVQSAIAFPGFVGIAIKEPFKGVYLAGLVRDPMIYRRVWRSEPLLIRVNLFTWESISVINIMPGSRMAGKTHSILS